MFTKKTEATPSVEEVQNLIVAEDNTSLTSSQERALDFLKAYVAKLESRAEGNLCYLTYRIWGSYSFSSALTVCW